MRFVEFSQPKPPTPEQARIDALKNQADKAKQAVKAEKAKQEVRRAQLDLIKFS